MKSLFITTDGAKLRIRKGRIIVEKDDEKILDLPLLRTRNIVILANSAITPEMLSRAVRTGARVWYTSKTGRLKAVIFPYDSFDAETKLLQVQAFINKESQLIVARSLVQAKIENQISHLIYRAKNKGISEIKSVIEDLNNLQVRVLESENIDEIRGYEGSASRIYFSVIGRYIAKNEFKFLRRTKRPPADPVNAVLSFCYSISVSPMVLLCLENGLIPDIGFLHANYRNRPALALDLIDPLRPAIDRFVFRLFNLSILKKEHFEFKANECLLGDAGRKLFLENFYELIAEDGLEEKISSSRLISLMEQECRALIDFLKGKTSAPVFVRVK